MPSVYDNLFVWARKRTSAFAELLVLNEDDCVAVNDDELIYRLRNWPHLPAQCKTADIYRVLSVMSSRPVNRHWILRNSGLPQAQVDRLLRRLVAEDAVEVIDASKFAAAAAGHVEPSAH